MPRGSSKPTSSPSDSAAANDVGMLQEEGRIENSGRYVIRKNYLVSDTAALITVPSPPTNFRPASLSWQALGGGTYQKTVEYVSFIGGAAGADVGGGSTSQVVETINGVSGRFELDTQDEVAPIETHPSLQTLLKKYNGTIDPSTRRATWPEKYSPQNGSGLTAGADGPAAPVKNPMSGVRFYTKAAAIFRHTQQMQFIPSDIWNNVGKMVAQLPAGFPNPPPYFNENGENIPYYWIVLSPQIYRQGESYQIVRSYKLSDPGVPSEMHKLTIASTTNTGGGANSGSGGRSSS
jgi:hypothetical protein